MADVHVENHGSIFLFFPQTDAAVRWIAENVEDYVSVEQGPLVVEHRFAHAIAEGMVVDGLEVV